MVARLPLAQREETATFIDLAKWAVQLFFINYTSLYIQYTVYRLIYYTIYRLPQKEEKVFQKAWVAQTPSPPKRQNQRINSCRKTPPRSRHSSPLRSLERTTRTKTLEVTPAPLLTGSDRVSRGAFVLQLRLGLGGRHLAGFWRPSA